MRLKTLQHRYYGDIRNSQDRMAVALRMDMLVRTITEGCVVIPKRNTRGAIISPLARQPPDRILAFELGWLLRCIASLANDSGIDLEDALEETTALKKTWYERAPAWIQPSLIYWTTAWLWCIDTCKRMLGAPRRLLLGGNNATDGNTRQNAGGKETVPTER